MKSVLKQIILTGSVIVVALILFFQLEFDQRMLALAFGLAGGLIWGINMFITHLVHKGMFGFVPGYGDHLLDLKASVYPGGDVGGVKVLPKYEKKKKSVSMAIILALYGAFDIGALIFLTAIVAQLFLGFFYSI